MNSVCVLSKYSTFSTSLPSSSAHDVLRSTCLPVRSIFVFRGRASGAAPPGPATPLMPEMPPVMPMALAAAAPAAAVPREEEEPPPAARARSASRSASSTAADSASGSAPAISRSSASAKSSSDSDAPSASPAGRGEERAASCAAQICRASSSPPAAASASLLAYASYPGSPRACSRVAIAVMCETRSARDSLATCALAYPCGASQATHSASFHFRTSADPPCAPGCDPFLAPPSAPRSLSGFSARVYE
mmetsp:Transcript_40593/g.121075  ORF Transcript_40593/g.121075 Transcript_40593/m.121075 type:complete len:249 (-) Transcript_40593:1216-1962(-)